MSIFDKFTERVGDFFDEVMIPEPVRRAHDAASRSMGAHEYDHAIAALRPTLIEHPNVARTHHLIGMCHFHRDEHGDAIAAFERALAIKEVAATHFYAGLAAEQITRWQDVQRHFSRALSLADDLPFAFELYFGLGRAYRELGRSDKAIKELRQALKVGPDQSDAILVLAETLLDAGRVDQAEEAMSHLQDSSQPRYLWTRARIDELRGEFAAALEQYETAAQQDSPVRVPAALGAARAALVLGLRDRAAAVVAELETPADGAAEVEALRGRLAELGGQPGPARAAYEAALAHEPRRADALLGLGRLALDSGDVDAAAAHFVRVFSAVDAAHRQEAWWGAGRCHLASGDLAGARHLFEEALEIDGPRTGEVAWSLGHTALQLGDAAEAIVFLRDAVELVPERLRVQVRKSLDDALARLAPVWELPDTLDDPERVLEVLNALLSYLGTDTRLSEFMPPTQRLFTAMNSPLSLAIVGEFNAGKSTIVNALLGEDVFPTGVLPTTAHTGILRWGPRKAARVVYRDGHRVEQSLAEAKKTMKTNADQIERVEFTHPHPDLRLVHYWDTPGFNALEHRHEDVATEALESAEAILWVMDANQVLSQTEFDRIESLPDGAERLLVVINKIDRLGPPGHREDDVEHLLDYVRENLEGKVAGVFAISAQDATSSDESVASESGFTAFRAFLEDGVIQRASRIKTIEVSRQLQRLVFTLHAFQNGLVQKYEGLSQTVAELETWLGRTASTAPRQRASDEVVTTADWVNRALEAVEAEISDSLRPRGSWTGKLSLPEDDREFVLDLVLQRFERILQTSRARITQHLAEVEREMAERLDPVVRSLAISDARSLQRRMDGFFDEARVVSMLWDERIYGSLRARAQGRISTSGASVLTTVEAAQSDPSAWRPALRRLLPPSTRNSDIA